MSELLKVDGLRLQIPVGKSLRTILSDVTVSLATGQSLGVVGESGSGKSMTLRSIMRLLPRGAVATGQVRYGSEDVTAMSDEELRRWWRSDVAMVFQDPWAHTNPVRKIGDFMTEGLRAVGDVSMSDARQLSGDLLARVQVADPARVMDAYPHELSGGQLQRVLIAAALTIQPRLLLADEPTTALDVRTQHQVMMLLEGLRSERDLALIFVTHDLALAAEHCDRTAVMHAGAVVEERRSEDLYSSPRHPYTVGLLMSRPSANKVVKRLPVIPGRPVAAWEAPSGCSFRLRCPFAQAICEEAPPPLSRVDGGHVACWRADELADGGMRERKAADV